MPAILLLCLGRDAPKGRVRLKNESWGILEAAAGEEAPWTPPGTPGTPGWRGAGPRISRGLLRVGESCRKVAANAGALRSNRAI